jgi:hypothetical protein
MREEDKTPTEPTEKRVPLKEGYQPSNKPRPLQRGYQPDRSTLDPTKPPQGGSGVPPKSFDNNGRKK